MNEIATHILATFTGYLLGSIPTAYIVTRVVTHEDIRRLGGGNVGGLNTLREVGLGPALIVVFIDLAKGSAAVLIAYYWFNLNDLQQPWFLVPALAAIAGHNWSIWLKFTGGKGMAAYVGAIFTAFLIYGYWPGIVILATIELIVLPITRNVALASSINLVAMPAVAWLGTKSLFFVIWTVIAGLIIGIKFLATGLKAWRSGERDNIIVDHSGIRKLPPQKRG